VLAVEEEGGGASQNEGGGMVSAEQAGRGLLRRSERILKGRVSTDPKAAPRICERLPPSDTVSPVILAAATRAIYDLIASPQRGTVRFGKVEGALEKAGGYWRRQGIYLSRGLTGGPSGGEETAYPSTAAHATAAASAYAETYAELFGRFLEAGFLLPPSADQPVILPAVLSEGEEAKLAKLLAFNPCGSHD
jgi:hypothetical protein